MKTNVYLEIVIRIALLGFIGMMWTFIPEQLHDFFGDTLRGSNWDWGTRHYWYSFTMVLIFIVTLLNLGFSIAKVVNKNYDTSEW